MKDLYRLESYIHQVWTTKETLNTLLWRLLDHPAPMTEDQIANTIIGIENIFDMNMEKLFDEYKKIAQLDEYAPAEAKALREELLAGIISKKKGKNK